MADPIRFAEFCLLPDARQLLRGTEPVALTARAFSVLLALVEQPGKLVTKDELLQRVWAGVVVEDNNIAVQVGVLRKWLGASAIATVPGLGYRFILPVVAAAGAPPPDRERRTNLPASLAPLIGRDVDTLAIGAWLQAQRLVTVVGAGGIGKSRLAQAVSAAQVGLFGDGVWWVELAGLADPALLSATVAQALNLSVQEREAQPRALAAALAERDLLLVLDNCEHLLEGAAHLVEELLKAAPRLRVLATSQEPLRLQAEQQYRLDPLAVPPDAASPGAREYGALALLVARVRAAAPRFELRDDELPLAIDLCRRLDGLPLAIELAGARVPLLGLRTVHDRLDERFRLLTAGSRTALRRHQTLRAALAWSHGLLDDPQRDLFMRLGAFSGGFTMALAQSLCGQAQHDVWTVLEQVSLLAEKSLVVVDSAVGPQPRYRLLESARAFALEQLAAAGQTHVCLRHHATAMLDFLRQVDGVNLDGELRTDEYAARVLPELDNLRAAYAWARSPEGDPQVAIGLAAHIGPLIDYSLEFTGWMLSQSARIATHPVDDATAARFWRGMAASNMVGYVNTPQRLEAADRAAGLYRRLDMPRRLYSSLRLKAAWHNLLGDHACAKATMDEGEALLKPDWSPELWMGLHRTRSFLARAAGDLPTALAHSSEAWRLAREVRTDWRLQVIEATVVADVLWHAGRAAEADTLLAGLIERMRTEPVSDYELVDTMSTRLWILSETGRLDEAAAAFREALPVMRRMPRYSLAGCAHLLWQWGRLESAAQVMGAHAALTQAGLDIVQFNEVRLLEATRQAIESALDPATLASLMQAGRSLSFGAVCDLLDEAVA